MHRYRALNRTLLRPGIQRTIRRNRSSAPLPSAIGARSQSPYPTLQSRRSSPRPARRNHRFILSAVTIDTAGIVRVATTIADDFIGIPLELGFIERGTPG